MKKIFSILIFIIFTSGWTDMTQLTLYYRPTCPYCLKVLKVIKEKQMNLELINISQSSEYEAQLIQKGGKKQVPCLLIGNTPLYESNDIINWLLKNYEKSLEENLGNP